MSDDDRIEIRAIAQFMENLIKTNTQHIPRSIELCGLGAMGYIIDICDKYDGEGETCEECMVGSCERRRKE